MAGSDALEAVAARAAADRETAAERWAAVVPASFGDLDACGERFASAGRITLNLHPDRVTRSGATVAAGLVADGRYRSQWATGASNGSRSAFVGGDRHGFEQALFGGAYDGADPARDELPVYGALDLLGDPFGGSPRFGSCYLVLSPHVRARTTLCVGDSHAGPRDVGTADAPWSLLAGLAEQAAAGTLLDRDLGLDDLLVLLGGEHPAVAGRRLDGYAEAQVHGGVSLADDVDVVVVDPSFAGTSVARDLELATARHGLDLRWHAGSELAAADVPDDVRGPTMPSLARRVARPDGIVDARAIGAAAPVALPAARPGGDPPDSLLQQLKFLWHVVFSLGHDAGRPS